MDKKTVKAFLLELECLTRKYKISIGGCGCCNSPFLDDENDMHPEAGYAWGANEGGADVAWTSPDAFTWMYHKNNMARDIDTKEDGNNREQNPAAEDAQS